MGTPKDGSLHAGHRERLRKRFLSTGFEGMEEHVVLELLLFYSVPRIDTNELAHRLINKFGSLRGVCSASFSELMSTEGVGENTAVLLMMIPHIVSRYMNGASFWYLLVTALLIVAFTYFYSSISFQPDEMAKNIQQQGGAVPSVRPGKPTADYLRRINGRLTLFAALFLAVLATVPTVFTVGLQTQIPFAASSILIAVSVVLETKRQLDDLLVSRNYDSIS